jgi:hypothetical protein
VIAILRGDACFIFAGLLVLAWYVESRRPVIIRKAR